MSVTFTEREALRQLIEYIKDERARLWDEYIKAVGRLAELDRLDNVHPEIKLEVPKTPVQIPEVKVESPIVTQVIENNVEEELEDEQQELDEYKGLPLADAVAKWNSERGFGAIEEDKQNQTSLFKASDIEATKDYDNRVNSAVKLHRKRSKQRDIKVLTKDIVSILKEAGRPLKTKDIIDSLEERVGVELKNPYNILSLAKKYEPKIESVKYGFYQYKY